MGDLVLHQSATPTCFENAHRLAALPPTYGISPIADADTPLPEGWAPPAQTVLAHMAGELEQALLPCGKAKAAKAAATLIAAYPQADHTSAAYAEMVCARLAECPADLLDAVLNRLIDSNPDFRPAPGRVKEAVQYQLAKRRLLLMRVRAAQRWWLQQRAPVTDIQVAKFDAGAIAAGIVRPLEPPGTAPVVFQPTVVQRRPRTAHLPGELLREARSALSQRDPGDEG